MRFSHEQLKDFGITLLRVMVGVVFVMHGAQKVFVYGHEGVTGAFTQMGVPFPAVSAALVAGVELLGGIALVLGLLTRFAAFPLAINMLVAVLLVHLQAGFFLPNGYEFALTLFAASLALTLTGGGALALDGVLLRGRAEPAADLRGVPQKRAA